MFQVYLLDMHLFILNDKTSTETLSGTQDLVEPMYLSLT